MTRLFLPLKLRKDEKASTELKNLRLNKRFGHTRVYLLYDTENKSTMLINNENHHFGGKISPWTKAKENNVEVTIAPHLGSNPYKHLSNAGVKIFRGDENETLDIIVDRFLKGELEELPEPPEGTSCSGKKHKHHSHVLT